MKARVFILGAVAILLLSAASLQAFPGRGHRGGFGFRSGFVRGPVFVSPYWGYPAYGWGFSGGYVPGYRYGNYGRVDFNIRPKSSQVYVDGAYIGVADDFDGGFFGSTATLPTGKRHIRIVSPDGQVVERDIYVMPGRELNVDIRF